MKQNSNLNHFQQHFGLTKTGAKTAPWGPKLSYFDGRGYTRSMESIYPSLRAQVAVGTFLMKSVVYQKKRLDEQILELKTKLKTFRN